MPENNEQLEDDVQLDAEEEVDGGKGILGLLKVVVPVVLLCLGGGAYLAYSQYSAIASKAVALGIDVGFAAESDEEKPVEYGQFATIDDLLINPAGSGGKRFLVVSLGVETQEGAVLAELTEKDIVVRDAVLRLLSRRTAEELGAIELRTEIKDEVLSELNDILQKGEIDRLYFTQYLLQ